jgi:autotransporter-associated beta strand protein
MPFPLTTMSCPLLPVRFPASRPWLFVFATAALLGLSVTGAQAQTFNFNAGTQSWNVAGNWSPSGFPNAVGASATFNSLTAAATVNLGAAITVGAMTFTNNGAFVRNIANGTGGSLILDATGSGEATITVSGTSGTTNNTTISASTTLNDTLRFTNNNVSGTGAATATMTGTITGAGGFIKDGPGRFSFSTVAKAYTGATVVNQGRLRMTGSGQMTGTSSIEVKSGGSLYLDGNSGVWSFGGGAALITLNGDGDNGGGSGTQGALRNQGSGINTLANPVALASNATIHTDGSSTLRLNGGLSGGFVLQKTGGGTLQLTTANSGTTTGHTVTNGTVLVDAASQLGTGALSFAQTTLNNPTVTLNNTTQTIAALSSTFVDTSGTQTQTLNLNGTALTINQATNTTFGVGAVGTLTSVIAGSGSVTKSGVGSLALTNANTFTGGTTVSAGTLEAAAADALGGTSTIAVNSGGTLLLSNTGTTDRINDAATVTLGGGTIAFSGNVTEGSSPGTGALTLTASSIIDFASGSSVINFGASQLATWTGGATLSIYNWGGLTTGGGNDQLLFGIGDTALTSAQLDQISFYSGAGTGFLGTGAFVGSLGEVVPVPEPSAVLVALGMFGLAGWREGRRSQAHRRASRLPLPDCN